MTRRFPVPCVEPGCGAVSMESRCPQHRRASRSPSSHGRRRPAGRHISARRNALIQKQRGLCANCGGDVRTGGEVDHIVSLWREHTPGDIFENCVLLCKPCHAAKTRAEAQERAAMHREQRRYP